MAVGQVGRICFFRLDENDELITTIKKKAEENNLRAGVLILIGALKNVTVGFYQDGEHKHIHLEEPLEIASCLGNIAIDEKGEVMIHTHLVISNKEGKAFGGHLMEGSHVGPTAELIIIEATEVSLKRALDKKTGLNLLRMG